mmetsp:Transcript_52326/g.97980  ORF Transcript_52326/g.97980 Transcript_52326/m.97980 type:complete len:207 (+) Transcript_52326:787-1407(+)
MKNLSLSSFMRPRSVRSVIEVIQAVTLFVSFASKAFTMASPNARRLPSSLVTMVLGFGSSSRTITGWPCSSTSTILARMVSCASSVDDASAVFRPASCVGWATSADRWRASASAGAGTSPAGGVGTGLCSWSQCARTSSCVQNASPQVGQTCLTTRLASVSIGSSSAGMMVASELDRDSAGRVPVHEEASDTLAASPSVGILSMGF